MVIFPEITEKERYPALDSKKTCATLRGHLDQQYLSSCFINLQFYCYSLLYVSNVVSCALISLLTYLLTYLLTCTPRLVLHITLFL